VVICESSVRRGANLFVDIMFKLGQFVLLAVTQGVHLLIMEARQYLLQRVQPPAARMQGGECLPFDQMLRTIVNFIASDHRAIA